MGIVGYGRIGKAVARRLEGFGCELLTTSRTGGVPLDELLERSDFVTVHCPLTPETRGLIGDDALARMKPTAYLVNTARGPVVDSGALARALNAGEIAGAALDVTDPEPLPGDHPLLDAPEPAGGAAHRLGHACHARPHGGDRGRQPARGARGPADAPFGQRGPHSPSTLITIRFGRPPSNSQ